MIHIQSIKLNSRLADNYTKKLRLENKLYINSPIDGLRVGVKYVDTHCNDGNDSKPIILGMHGNMKNYEDFQHLIKYFNSKNYRVIIPDLRDFDISSDKQVFWHSAEERAQLVRDLLKAINVREVDALVCHSGGIFAGI